MTEESLPQDALADYQAYLAWSQEYGPFQWIDGDSDGSPNYLRAKAVDDKLVWTEYLTSEHAELFPGFEGESNHWQLHGWYVTSKPRSASESSPKSVIVSFDGKCSCFDEEREDGEPDCEFCEGRGYRFYDFDQ